MESLKSYLTKEGWKEDLKRTKEDLSDIVFKDVGTTIPCGLLAISSAASLISGTIALFGNGEIATGMLFYGASYVLYKFGITAN